MVEKFLDQAHQEIWRCEAWYYLPRFVSLDIQATTPEAALAMLHCLMKQNPGFWNPQRLDHDGASPINIEVRDAGGNSVEAAINATLVLGRNEAAPAISLLRDIMEQISAFDLQCREAEETDTGEVWSMFNDWRQRVSRLLGPPRRPSSDHQK